MNPTPPAAGFHFSLSIESDHTDAAFQEISGISMTSEMEATTEGGVNRFQHQVPGRTTYSDLVLKRGMIAESSNLAKWCQKTLGGDPSNRITPKLLKVTLFDEGQNPILRWKFANAYPIKWSIRPSGAADDTILVESMTFAYSYYEQVDD